MKIDIKIKAILFDLDDTLLNSKKSEYNAICEFKKLFTEFDMIDNMQFFERWHIITMKAYEAYLSKEISFENMRKLRMKNLFLYFTSKVLSDNEAQKIFDIYFNLYEKNWILFDDTIHTLEKLKDSYKLAIVTNGDSELQRKKIDNIGVKKYFSEIIISSEVGVSKPDKEIFRIACKRLKVEPEECVMIGDKFKVDIKGAIRSGMKAIWINRKNEDIEYEYKINKLSQIFEII